MIFPSKNTFYCEDRVKSKSSSSFAFVTDRLQIWTGWWKARDDCTGRHFVLQRVCVWCWQQPAPRPTANLNTAYNSGHTLSGKTICEWQVKHFLKATHCWSHPGCVVCLSVFNVVGKWVFLLGICRKRVYSFQQAVWLSYRLFSGGGWGRLWWEHFFFCFDLNRLWNRAVKLTSGFISSPLLERRVSRGYWM